MADPPETSERDHVAAALVCREVAELPDRDPCEHMTPDDMLVTADELAPIVAEALAAAREEGRREGTQWRPIDRNTPTSEPILVNSPHGHRGRDSCEVMVLVEDDEEPDGFSYWTNGGPNAGSDFHFAKGERPTHWLPLPESQAAQWRPIETAPRDLTRVFVAHNMGEPWGWVRGIAYWVPQFGGAWVPLAGASEPPGVLGLDAPTHWLPLPEAPG